MNIFISYSWKNKDVVWDVYEKLKAKMPNCTFFLDKEILKTSDSYFMEIKKYLNNTNIFIIFNSEDYLNSQACNAEMNLTRDKMLSGDPIKIMEIQLDNTKSPEFMTGKLYLKSKESNYIADNLVDSINNSPNYFKQISELEILNVKDEYLIKPKMMNIYNNLKLIIYSISEIDSITLSSIKYINKGKNDKGVHSLVETVNDAVYKIGMPIKINKSSILWIRYENRIDGSEVTIWENKNINAMLKSLSIK